ncbi:MAG: sigma-54 dependent transcriptional regulator [Acidobacteriota bacterium]
MKERVLLAEDEEYMRTALRAALEGSYEVVEARSGTEAIDLVRAQEFATVISDLLMPGAGGLQVLDEVKRLTPDSSVVIMTAFGDVKSAVEAMRLGAFDYLAKPFDVDELKVVLEKAVALWRLKREMAYLRAQLQSKYEFGTIIGKSRAMQAVFDFIRRTIGSDYPLLITGESGTGKELVARVYHFNGPRRERPFVAINCSTLSSELIESELFGHVKGAFSGAIRDKEGLFEAADGGTIFLDEIGEMSANLQARLLRVLEDGEVRRVGGTQTRKVDVRVVSATNRDLEEEVEQGRFRQDLYYRLNLLHLGLPPLRARHGDVPLLVFHYQQASGSRVKDVDPAAVDALDRYSWPGNVRELENVVKRACLLARSETVTVDDLPERIRSAAQAQSTLAAHRFLPLSSVVSSYIEDVLRASGGNISEAARILDVPRSTLRGKLKTYGVDEKGP